MWVLVAFFASRAIVEVVVGIVIMAGVDMASIGSIEVLQTILSAIVYMLTLGIVIGGPLLVYKQQPTRDILGLQRLMSWSDIGLAPIVYIAYILTLLGVLGVVTALFPEFQSDQAQDIGFKNLSSQGGYVLAFVTLVVIAPIAEEVLFRGYLYGKLREYVPLWAAAVATSLLFGIVHGQWNVAIDTFVLSLFLCGLRELTGSIWSGVLVHMLKNSIAFYIMFLAPFTAMGG